MFIPPWSGQKCQPSAHNHKEKSWRIHPILHIECFCLLLPANSIEHCKIPRDFIVFIGFPRRPSVYCTSSTKSGKVLTLFPALRLFHETKHALVQRVLSSGDRENRVDFHQCDLYHCDKGPHTCKPSEDESCSG